MKNVLVMALAAAAVVGLSACGMAEPAGKKPLIVYFTWSGNSRELANQVRSVTDGDVFQIEPVNAYPTAYRATTEQAKREQNEDARPAIKVSRLPNLESYDTIVLIHPNWWGTIPMPVATLLEANDLSGKKIAQLVTHEGSGVGRSAGDLKRYCPNSELLAPLAVRGGAVSGSAGDVEAWLKRIGVAK